MVHKESDAVNKAGKLYVLPKTGDGWTSAGNKPASNVRPIFDALRRSWQEVELTVIAAAMHGWDAYAMELFDSWEANGARTKANVEAALKGHSEAAQLEYLRRQIEMRVLGLGWTQFATRWSSQADERIGTVAHLKALLVGELLPEEATPCCSWVT